MAGSMMRVTPELVRDIKLLKEIKSYRGALGTHNNLVHDLVKDCLRKTHADTEQGFIPVGSVVLGPNSEPLVIEAIENGKVTFNDKSYVINGSPVCFNMQLLAENVGDFNGGLFNG